MGILVTLSTKKKHGELPLAKLTTLVLVMQQCIHIAMSKHKINRPEID